MTMVAPLQVVMEAPFPVDHGRTTELALRPRPSGSLEKEHREKTRKGIDNRNGSWGIFYLVIFYEGFM